LNPLAACCLPRQPYQRPASFAPRPSQRGPDKSSPPPRYRHFLSPKPSRRRNFSSPRIARPLPFPTPLNGTSGRRIASREPRSPHPLYPCQFTGSQPKLLACLQLAIASIQEKPCPHKTYRMFDVHWDDGALESIGHKKTRGTAKKNRKKDNEKLRASISSRSSLSSGDKPSSFFGNFSLKRNSSRRGSSKLNPPTAGNNSRTTSLRSQPALPLPAIGHTLECSIPNNPSIHIGLTPTSCEFDQPAVSSVPPSLVHSEENSTKRSSKGAFY